VGASVNSSGTLAAIRGFVFDFGEVLTYRPTHEQMATIARRLGRETTNFYDVYIASRAPYDQGLVSSEEYWNGLAAPAGRPLSAGTIEGLRELDMEIWSRINPSMVAWIDRLQAAGYRLGLISNMHPDMARHTREKFGWMDRFDAVLLSGELHQIKPDPPIFEECFRRLGLPASALVMVDDRPSNLATAERLGMQSLLFHGVEALRKELTVRGFSVLPP
jgi:putative hydrolase of the HAD superfamily